MVSFYLFEYARHLWLNLEKSLVKYVVNFESLEVFIYNQPSKQKGVEKIMAASATDSTHFISFVKNTNVGAEEGFFFGNIGSELASLHIPPGSVCSKVLQYLENYGLFVSQSKYVYVRRGVRTTPLQ